MATWLLLKLIWFEIADSRLHTLPDRGTGTVPIMGSDSIGRYPMQRDMALRTDIALREGVKNEEELGIETIHEGSRQLDHKAYVIHCATQLGAIADTLGMSIATGCNTSAVAPDSTVSGNLHSAVGGTAAVIGDHSASDYVPAAPMAVTDAQVAQRHAVRLTEWTMQHGDWVLCVRRYPLAKHDGATVANMPHMAQEIIMCMFLVSLPVYDQHILPEGNYVYLSKADDGSYIWVVQGGTGNCL
ncbi:hypothetical protein DFJ73DRAFT_768079 [Zopfochytrium polystomum]|nr:hypothetical protein DFJ73DRAFT_768079 [Zopfochytrium polystomum]